MILLSYYYTAGALLVTIVITVSSFAGTCGQSKCITALYRALATVIFLGQSYFAS